MAGDAFTYQRNPVIFPSKAAGNDLFPLPPDFESLTEQGKRLARVNACSIHRAPGATAVHAIASWHYFTHYYLHWSGAEFFQSDEPDGDPLPTPWFHYQMVADAHNEPRLSAAAPRGGAKSTWLKETALQDVYTRRNYKLGYMTSVGPLLKPVFDDFKFQIVHNARLNDDFGSLKPKKGEGAFDSAGLLILPNRCSIIGMTTEGTARGQRPHKFLLDDPEYDPEASTDVRLMRQRFARLLFQNIVPMLRKGARAIWMGTIISKQHMLWQAWEALDPRFGMWFRVRWPAILADGTPLWREWMDLHDLKRRELEIGVSNMAAEYFNAPGEDQDATFRFSVDRHVAAAVTIDSDLLTGNPFTSNAIIRPPEDTPSSHNLTGGTIRMSDLMGRLQRRFLLVDAAPSWGPSSDPSALVVLGQDGENTVWSLDVVNDRMDPPTLLRHVWRLVRRWRVQIIGVENVGVQQTLNHYISTQVADLGPELGYVPQVMKVPVPARVRKEEKIAGMQWRFEDDRIVFCGWLLNDPHYQELVYQVENFREAMPGGGLPHDDCVDAMAQSIVVIRGRPARAPGEVQEEEKDLVQRLKDGDYKAIMGLDLRSAVFNLPGGIPQGLLPQLIDANEKTTTEAGEWDDDRDAGRSDSGF